MRYAPAGAEREFGEMTDDEPAAAMMVEVLIMSSEVSGSAV